MHVPLTPVRCLARARDVFGSRTGVIDGEHRFCFADFAERAQRLAGALLELGLEPGEPVAFLCRNQHPLLEGYFGVPLARGVLLPINIRLAPAELAWILHHSAARFLFYAEEFTAVVSTLEVENRMRLGSPYEELLARATPATPEIETFDELSPASLFYTSGTTGTAKGVIHSHRALYLHALSVALTFHIDDSTVELYTIPLFHANGWGRPHAAALMGARQVLLPRFSPEEVFRLIETERVTSMGLVPTMAERLLASPAVVGRDLSSMREIHLGGSSVSAQLLSRLEQRFQCLCTAGYGMTETGPVATTGRPKEGAPQRRHEAGWPVVGAAVRVRDGEIEIAGDHLMTGCHGEPPRESPWLKTGDLGDCDQEQFLTLRGRKKDVIVSGGENIGALEVENILSSHPAVSECAVIAVPEPQWGEIPLAVVVLRSPATEADLATWLTGRIARFKVPKLWRFLPGPLPRTASGKVLKSQLRPV